MPDLAAWLLEQIDTDEQTASAAAGPVWYLETVPLLKPKPMAVWSERLARDENLVAAPGPHPENLPHIATWHPARVLAECAAKRRIIACALEDCPGGYADGIGFALSCIATVYADRPGFDPAWAPSGTIPT